jgi:hypothetical protein
MSGKISIKRPVALVVEGVDLLHLIRSQIMDDPSLDRVQLFDFGSIDDLPAWLRLFVTLSGFNAVETLGVIRDAEYSSASAIDAVKSAMISVGYTPPTRVLEIAPGRPNLGYMILPHDQDSGCVEDSLLASVDGLPSVACVKRFLACVDDGSRNSNWRAKVQVHAMIAGSRYPNLTLGDSAKAGLWDFTKPPLRVILDFVRSLNDAPRK